MFTSLEPFVAETSFVPEVFVIFTSLEPLVAETELPPVVVVVEALPLPPVVFVVEMLPLLQVLEIELIPDVVVDETSPVQDALGTTGLAVGTTGGLGGRRLFVQSFNWSSVEDEPGLTLLAGTARLFAQSFNCSCVCAET
ncbi:MAG: hypothetical protein A2008_06115 [Candidatus Wallbacteria bacterium GWC2_49_35]|uniref:Uncharacterized protein n=1 Tax=Candidatus Wallbacteria bacterium GWC2_49_35 TaxID=1817813 RepID=A0A1F7WFL4_9BACT|nr:MAG: hypothetical protein A2008_06115 [Candidatus Wallbacteria bacterium GWC2_49_35]